MHGRTQGANLLGNEPDVSLPVAHEARPYLDPLSTLNAQLSFLRFSLRHAQHGGHEKPKEKLVAGVDVERVGGEVGLQPTFDPAL